MVLRQGIPGDECVDHFLEHPEIPALFGNASQVPLETARDLDWLVSIARIRHLGMSSIMRDVLS